MAIKIKPISKESILVNKKVVYLDRNGNWLAVSQLTPEEENAFKNYHKAYLTVCEESDLPEELPEIEV